MAENLINMIFSKYILSGFVFLLIYTSILIPIKYRNHDISYTCFITTIDVNVTKKLNQYKFEEFNSHNDIVYNAKIILSEKEFVQFKSGSMLSNLSLKFHCKKNKLNAIEVYLISFIISLFIFNEYRLLKIKK